MDIIKEQPLVTVYMPTHNRVELLQRAAESVLNQSYKNIELIIVDDKSTDSTHEYLAELVKKDSRVSFFINKENSGACVSRNKAIFSAKGEFITGLDDDDYFLSNHIISYIEAWEKSNGKVIALYPEVYVKKLKNRSPDKIKKKSDFYSYKDLICANWIGNQVFLKTDSLRHIGGFDEDFPAWQDLECWYRLLKTYNVKAQSTGVYSYVLDASHPFERISTKKISLIEDAFELFYKKHNLNRNCKAILALQLGLYKKEIPKVTSILRKVFYMPRLYNFRHAVILVLIPFLSCLG